MLVLVDPLHLLVRLGVEGRRQIYGGAEAGGEHLPEPGGELRALIRHHVLGETVDPKNVLHQLSCLLGRQEFREGDEVGSLRKPFLYSFRHILFTCWDRVHGAVPLSPLHHFPTRLGLR